MARTKVTAPPIMNRMPNASCHLMDSYSISQVIYGMLDGCYNGATAIPRTLNFDEPSGHSAVADPQGPKAMNARLNKEIEYVRSQVPSPSKLISRRADRRRQRVQSALGKAKSESQAAQQSVQDEIGLRIELVQQADERVYKAQQDVDKLTEELEARSDEMTGTNDVMNTVSYSPQKTKSPVVRKGNPLHWRYVAYVVKSMVSGVRPNKLNDQAAAAYELFHAQWQHLLAPRTPGSDW
jgi:hypothetical protein